MNCFQAVTRVSNLMLSMHACQLLFLRGIAIEQYSQLEGDFQFPKAALLLYMQREEQ